MALVTGSAHRLGKAFAMTLASQGYAILLHYHSSHQQAEQTAEEIRHAGVPVYPVQADLREPAGILALFSTMDTLSHPLRVLVNSAGVMPHAPLDRLPVEEWDGVLNLNLRAPYLLAQKAAERMTPPALIVNVSDVGAHKLWAGYPAYVVSKSALETLTRLMAKAYAPGIRVNAISPGLVLPAEGMDPGEWQRLVARLPLGRPATTGEITATLEFLLMNGSITGQTIVVDGGYALV